VRGGLVLIRPAVALILSALIGAGLVAYRGLSPFTTLAVIFFASLVVSFGLNIRRSGPIT
jgi:hypothetical protein